MEDQTTEKYGHPLERDAAASAHRATWITLGLLFVGALYLCLLVLRPFAAPLIAGAMLAVLFHPYHRWVLGGMPKHPTLAAFVTTLFVLIVFVIPLGFVVSLVVKQMRAALEAMGANGIGDGAQRIWATLEGPFNTVASWFGTTAEELREMLVARLREASAAGLSLSVAVVGGATAGVIKGVVAILTLFFALRDGASFTEAVVKRSPLGKVRTERLLTAACDTIFASFYGVLAVAATQGGLVWVAAWIAGLPSPVLWGLGAAAASLLPVFGASLAWLPAAIYLFAQRQIGMGVFMLVWGAVVVSNADNIVRPLVLMARVSANPLVVFIAILGGIQAFGLLGILLGPVVLGVTLTLIDIIREEVDDAHNGA